MNETANENKLNNTDKVFTPAFRIEKPVFVLNGSDCIYFVLFTLICFAVVSWGLYSGFRIGFTVSFLALYLCMFFYLKDKKIKQPLYAKLCAVLAIILSLNFTLSRNDDVNTFSFVMMFFLTAVYFASLSGQKLVLNDDGAIRNIFSSVFATLLKSLGILPRSMLKGAHPKGGKIAKALIGVLCAVPVVAIILPLLVSSDAAFEGLIDSLFTKTDINFNKTIISLCLVPLLTSYAMGLKHLQPEETSLKEKKHIDNTYIISFLGVISLCYVAYLLSQLAYFFSAFSGILPDEYTFGIAQYARRGFFEMSIIALLNFVLVFAFLKSSGRFTQRGKEVKILKALLIFICVFTLTIILTALSKMIMYIDIYGMSILRITTSAFMVFLFGVFVMLIIKCVKQNVDIIKFALVFASVILIILGIGNVNEFVAKYNYNAYISGKLKSIDVQSISELGDSSVEYLIYLTDNSDPTVKAQAEDELYYRIMDYYHCEYSYVDNAGEKYPTYKITTGERTYSQWHTYTYSTNKAYKLLDEFLSKNEGKFTRTPGK